jgi:DNA-binding NtrC family response regulator
LFLDEVGDMPLSQQVACYRRSRTVRSRRSVVAHRLRRRAHHRATNRDLRRLVDQGAFREDLYYRLNVIPIEIRPLRDRKADIPALGVISRALRRAAERDVRSCRRVLASLMQSDWPGNVRELQNYIERVMAMTPGPVLVHSRS